MLYCGDLELEDAPLIEQSCDWFSRIKHRGAYLVWISTLVYSRDIQNLKDLLA